HTNARCPILRPSFSKSGLPEYPAISQREILRYTARNLQETSASMGLIVRSSEIHAAGCYTTSYIRKDTYIVEYTGPRISQEEADARYDSKTTTYLFGLTDPNKIIDGHGIAMFINHCCEPNCDTEEIEGRVWIVARRNIKAGEELTYDYNLYDGAKDDP